MKTITTGFIVDSISGEILNGSRSTEITGVSIDSRTIKNGELFIAIIGERLDGHQFLDKAVEKGAAAVIVDRPVEFSKNITVIRVADTTRALQELARVYRLSLKNLKVVGITGSAGKTSTKDMTASILARKYKVKKTAGNLNNYYGLPLTILSLEGDEDIAVLEMGMSALGEIELLSKIASPDIGIITNVGETHLETLGSIENVARGKSELISNLSDNGIAVLNFDNKYVRKMKDVFTAKDIIYYGLSPEADIYAVVEEEQNDSNYRISDGNSSVKGSVSEKEIEQHFTVYYQGEKIELSLDRPGKHNIYNSLAAIAVARIFNIDWSDIKEGLSTVDYSALRWDVRINNQGIKIVNDTYNANPLSMRAVIEAVLSMKAKRVVLTLGSMLELGIEEEKAHLDLGEYISGKSVDFLLAVGEKASLIADGAEDGGMNKMNIKRVADNDEATAFLNNYLNSGDLLLVKGSRGNKMEEIVDKLL